MIDWCRARLNLEATLIWFHGARAILSLVLIPIAIYLGWVYSILFLSLLSLVTYSISEVTAWQASWSARREAKRMREHVERS